MQPIKLQCQSTRGLVVAQPRTLVTRINFVLGTVSLAKLEYDNGGNAVRFYAQIVATGALFVI